MHLTTTDLASLKHGTIVFEAAINNQVRRLQYIGILTCLSTYERKHTFISDYLLSTLLIDADNPNNSIPIIHRRVFFSETEAVKRIKESKQPNGQPLLPAI